MNSLPTDRPRILLAEDNAEMRVYLELLLKPYYNVTVVTNGQAALDAFYRQPPDLVLSDVVMPLLDGIQLLQLIKAQPHTVQVPVILVSAHGGEKSRINAYETGADDYLSKPFSSVELLARVRAQLEHARVRGQAETSLQSIVAQAPFAIYILCGTDFEVEMANEKQLKIWGRPAAQVLKKPLFDAIPEAGRQGFRELLTRVLTTGEVVTVSEMPVTLPTAHGSNRMAYLSYTYQFMHDPANGPGRIMAVGSDVTETVLARQKIEANEQLLSAMIRQTPLGISVLRGTNFVVEVANAVVCQIWDRMPEQVLGKPLFETLPEIAGQGFEELLLGVLETGIPFEGRELPATYTRNGQLETAYFDLIYQRLHGASQTAGEDQQIMVVGIDVTKNRAARLEVEQSEANYQQLAVELDQRVKQRTQDLERSNLDLMQFASIASHDLREPLRKMQTFGTLLEEMLAGRLDEQEADLFRRLVKSASRMQTLVGDILRFSILSDQTTNFEPVDLNAVINQIGDDLELTIRERNAELTTALLPTVLAEPGQIHQLFQNLISNALKFNDGLQPAVRIEPVPLTDELASELALPARDYVVITVTDNGIGIDGQYRDKIFGMFQRLHGRNRYAGTGIGLTIVKKVIENHRGAIDVQSEPGRGTTFRVALPMMRQPAPPTP